MNQNEITDIKFMKVKKNLSHVGFVDFKYNNNFAFNGQAVHTRLNPIKGQSKYRVLWRIHSDKNYYEKPICCPINKETQELVDREVSAYIIANGEL